MQTHLAAVPPFLSWAGPTSAIIIGLYLLVFMILALVLCVGGAFAVYWINKKIGIIRLVRPEIISVNKTAEEAIMGIAPPPSQNKIISTIAGGPARLHAIDKQVEDYGDRVVNIAIEFQARTLQFQTVAKAFFLPGLSRRATIKAALEARLDAIQRERNAPELPAGSVAKDAAVR